MRNVKKGLFALLSSAMLVWLAAGSGGCGGPPYRQFCENLCECTGMSCSPAEQDACVTLIEDLRDDAVKEGCAAQFDDTLSCYATISCSDEDQCAGTEQAFNKCVNSGEEPSPCDAPIAAISDKIASCGSENPVPNGGDCKSDDLAQLECTKACFDAASCDALTGADTAARQAFIDCQDACSP